MSLTPHSTKPPLHTQNCDAELRGCDVSSETGSAVGVEGGAPTLAGCTLHGTPRNGVAIFGDLETGECGCTLSGCTIAGNKLAGVLVRDGAAPSVLDCDVSRNGGWGIDLRDCGGEYRGNRVAGNGRGALAYALLAEGVTPAALASGNSLDAPPRPG